MGVESRAVLITYKSTNVKISFIRHIFVTLTYARNSTSAETWQHVSKDFNRFLQKFRRSTRANVGYLRTLEAHKDGYPHIHAIIQFPDARVRIKGDRYFSDDVFRQFKSTWPHGHSDFQVPFSKREGQIYYIMKYIQKNSTSKTVWKKLYGANNVTESTTPPIDSSVGALTNTSDVATKPISKSITVRNPTHFNKQKLCSWSRNFDFSPFFINSKK